MHLDRLPPPRGFTSACISVIRNAVREVVDRQSSTPATCVQWNTTRLAFPLQPGSTLQSAFDRGLRLIVCACLLAQARAGRFAQLTHRLIYEIRIPHFQGPASSTRRHRDKPPPPQSLVPRQRSHSSWRSSAPHLVIFTGRFFSVHHHTFRERWSLWVDFRGHGASASDLLGSFVLGCLRHYSRSMDSRIILAAEMASLRRNYKPSVDWPCNPSSIWAIGQIDHAKQPSTPPPLPPLQIYTCSVQSDPTGILPETQLPCLGPCTTASAQPLCSHPPPGLSDPTVTESFASHYWPSL